MGATFGLGLSLTNTGKRGPSAPVAPVADILLDFVNGIYRVDGTTYATAALAGFPGTGTFDANGYTAVAGTDVLAGTVNLSGDFAVFATFDQPTTNALLWRHEGSTTCQIYKMAGGEYLENPAITGATSSNCTRAAYARSGGTQKVSFDGAAVVTGGALIANGSAPFQIGNAATGGYPWGVPIKKIAIYKQTLTNAQMQALV